MFWLDHKKKMELLPSQEIKQNYTSTLWRLENLYPIYPKDGPPINFKLNQFQMTLFKHIAGKEDNTEPIVVLKARQLGITTFFAILFLDRVLYYGGVSAVIQADKEENLHNIFRITRLAYENCIPLLPLREDHKSRRYTQTLIENKKNNSWLKITLETKSQAINMVHFSELAFQKVERYNTTLGATTPGCFKAVESTPFGLNLFHKVYYRQKLLRNSFFFPWHKNPEYAVPLPAEGLKDLTLEEVQLRDTFKLSLEQIHFRRRKLDEGMLPRVFDQEYPSDDDSCFLLSGSAIIDLNLLKKLKHEAEAQPPKEAFNEGNMRFKIYEIPTPEFVAKNPGAFVFTVGVDPAEGVGQDYSAGVVLMTDNRTGQARVLMTMHGFEDPTTFSFTLHRYILKYFKYGDYLPRVVVEANNHGGIILNNFRVNKDCLYPSNRLYYDIDKVGLPRRAGFLTTSISRKRILNNLANSIRLGNIDIRDPAIIGELMTFTFKESKAAGGGRFEAEEGANDDLVMAIALAWQGFYKSHGRMDFDMSPESAIS